MPSTRIMYLSRHIIIIFTCYCYRKRKRDRLTNITELSVPLVNTTEYVETGTNNKN